MAFEVGFSTRKRCSKECLALFSTSSRKARLLPRCGVKISTLWPARSVSVSSSSSRSSKSVGDVNRFRQIFRFQIELFEKRGHEFLRIEFFEFFPVEFAAVDDAAAAQVK